ncbi:hypothetical protein ACW11F_11625, partial [Luteimonas sp. e5]
MLITCPPMAAMFFQGTLGHAVTMYSQFGAQGGQARDLAGNPVGGGEYRPADRQSEPELGHTAIVSNPYKELANKKAGDGFALPGDIVKKSGPTK